jgi:hypothetical protein
MPDDTYGSYWNMGSVRFFGGKKLGGADLEAKQRLNGQELRAEALAWRQVAQRVGESLDSVGQPGYYEQGPAQWRDWALAAIWHKHARIKALENELIELKAFYYRESAAAIRHGTPT